MVEMCLAVSLGGGGGYDDKEPANIHLGVIILRKFCIPYKSMQRGPLHRVWQYLDISDLDYRIDGLMIKAVLWSRLAMMHDNIRNTHTQAFVGEGVSG